MHSSAGFEPIELLNYGKMLRNLGQNYPDHGSFQTFTNIVEIGWIRVIYDGSGKFQVFSGFLWPKLRVPHCNLNSLFKDN